ncbi:hypothetical protein GM921_00780 [Pedobacter sp. LMG 31464]|uniref:Response regulator receiver domain-containing protein n=1 Tax=Pedobacter planticolens TaxID=2679964 RepID=A0A923DWK8_9SPHI|nr:hypothetical protein [Pedobacter planticolens]MBB2144005.1 hypothetical protein [Pedobacter planticolens]
MPTCFIFAENLSINAIAPHIEQLSLPIIGTATTFDEGFRLIMGFKPEIVFIDMIFVQRYSEELQLLKHKTSFVVISDTTADAFAAFEFHALDYLLKPVKYTRLIKSIEIYQSIEARFALGQKINPEI